MRVVVRFVRYDDEAKEQGSGQYWNPLYDHWSDAGRGEAQLVEELREALRGHEGFFQYSSVSRRQIEDAESGVFYYIVDGDTTSESVTEFVHRAQSIFYDDGGLDGYFNVEEPVGVNDSPHVGILMAIRDGLESLDQKIHQSKDEQKGMKDHAILLEERTRLYKAAAVLEGVK